MFGSTFRGALCVSTIVALGILAGCSQFGGGAAIKADRNQGDVFTQAVDAAFTGDLAYVKQCVESDARYLEAVDDFGRTLLHYAAEGGHADIVNYLLDQGAYAGAQDEDGNLPLDAAIQGGAPKDLVDLLKKAAVEGR